MGLVDLVLEGQVLGPRDASALGSILTATGCLWVVPYCSSYICPRRSHKVRPILVAHLGTMLTRTERPVHALLVAFAASAFLLLSLGRAFPALFQAPNQQQGGGDFVPLDDRSSPQPRRTRSSLHARYNAPGLLGPFLSRLLLVGAVCALPIRVEFYRRTAKATECTTRNPAVFLPLLIAVYDAARSSTLKGEAVKEDLNGVQPKTRLSSISQRFLRSPMRFVLPAFIVSAGSYSSLEIWDGVNSTYICPIAGGEPQTIPFMQWASLIFDAFIAIALYEISLSSSASADRSRSRPYISCAFVLFTACIVWTAVGVAVYLAKPHYLPWLIPVDLLFSTNLVFSLLWQTLLCSGFAISTACWVLHCGLLDAAMTLTTTLVTIPCLHFIWTAGAPYPPISMASATLPLTTVLIGRRVYGSLKRGPGQSNAASALVQITLLSLLLAILWAGWTRKQHVAFHPIDTLIYDAKVGHDEYSTKASLSRSLNDAVMEYRRKYQMNPPPDFDIWYEYATNRSAFVIDEFDQIHNDLLPFRALSPDVLRRRTWEMVSNPWNEISGITIRKGTATVQENVIPTHRWMLEGVAILINSFARYLPDMDLAFNLNDESRVSVPWSDLETLRLLGSGLVGSNATSSLWSANRTDGWLPIPEHDYTESIFENSAFQNIFAKFGSVGCSPDSESRKRPIINDRSHICWKCAAPHSLGQFLANWTQSADICHQPDLAHLHGFYMSPAAFKGSHQLMPVFSQSKPYGFNDILYPSAWNYMDKAIYDPDPSSGTPGSENYKHGFPDVPFSEKKNLLFWRGATSEGVSSGDHAWRGMTRQRLVHMASNLTSSAHDRVTILLPDPSAGKGRLKYQTISGTEVKTLELKTDIAIVDGIARCGGIGLHDCTDQDAEFGLVKPSDFQSHWQYRYLFDLDGAAFSGRFLPFLQSRSLPFKTALFREWYDSRITAWQHFVPQDLRLHGVWSTLAYFAGVEGKVNGRDVKMKAHLEEGEAIATAGREWAAKVLRKEDMEIYFFRLLLEWGRLTDDRRDELGFSV